MKKRLIFLIYNIFSNKNKKFNNSKQTKSKKKNYIKMKTLALAFTLLIVANCQFLQKTESVFAEVFFLYIFLFNFIFRLINNT